MQSIRPSTFSDTGNLEFLYVALDELSTIKSSAQALMAKEPKLHVRWNNAGLSQPPPGSVSKQGIQLQLATNCLGPFLFTQLLPPLLETTAASRKPGTVRVNSTASQMVELTAPNHGIIMSELSDPPTDKTRIYNNPKTGNLSLATELARRVKGVVSVAQNPGAACTELFRHTPLLANLAWPLLYKAELAELTAL